MAPKAVELGSRAVVCVGEGRGFVVEAVDDRLVALGEGIRECERLIITAGHCLPSLPESVNFLFPEERTYKNLIGPLGSNSRTVWAECMFVDPISDLAVLGSPEVPLRETPNYEALVDALEPLAVAGAPLPKESRGWLLSLNDNWFQCQIEYSHGGPLWLTHAAQPIMGGMSGSPILSDEGTAIGVLVTGGDDDQTGDGGPQPRLGGQLPSWLLAKLTVRVVNERP